MLLTHWLKSLLSSRATIASASPRRKRARRVWEKRDIAAVQLGVAETLEDRTLLASFTVDIAADEFDFGATSTGLSLREAIFLANTDNGTPNGDDDTISFAPALAGTTILLSNTSDANDSNPDLDITDTTGSLMVVGLGANQLTINAQDAAGVRIFDVAADASITISGLTLTGGNAQNISGSGSTGGAIRNLSGSVTVIDSRLTGNRSTGNGGAIDNTGILQIFGSTLDGNTSGGSGGGLTSRSTGITSIVNSTISGNTAGSGGGIAQQDDSTVRVVNSTVTENSATDLGGGIHFQTDDTVTLHNTIVAGNQGPAQANDLTGAQNNDDVNAASSFNLIGVNDAAFGGITNGSQGNQIGTLASPLDPLLAALADNGGPTPTHALVFGSPAVDAGTNGRATVDGETGSTALQFDQRGSGFLRILDGTVDIGAFEFEDPFIPDVTIDGTAGDDTVVVALDGADIVVTVGGAEQLRQPLASTDSLTLNGDEGDDSFQIDFTNGAIPIPINVNGGGQATPGGDSLDIVGGTFQTITYTFTTQDADGNNGNVVSTSGATSTIHFTGLEPLTNTGNANDIVFNLPNVANPDVVLQDSANAGESELVGTTFENTVFVNPTGSLTITGGTMADAVSVQGVDAAWDADLIVNATDAGDTVTFETNATDIGSGNVVVAAGAIAFGATLTTTGNADLTATSARILGDTALQTDLAAATAILRAADGIGEIVGITSFPLQLSVSNVEADGGTGLVQLDNDKTLEIGGISALNGVAADGAISIFALGDLLVSETISNTDAGSTTDLTADDDLTIDAAINTGGSDALLDAGNDFTLNSTIDSDGGIVQAFAGNDLTINGSILSGGEQVQLQADNDILFTAAGLVDAEVVASTPDMLADAGRHVTMADGAVINGRSGTVNVTSGFNGSGDITVGQFLGTSQVFAFAANGSILDGGDAGGADIVSEDASLEATGGGTIGTSGNSLDLDIDQLTTATSTGDGDQFLSEANTLTWNTSSAGTGDIRLTGGRFNVGAGQTITATTVTIISSATLGGTGTVDGSVTAMGGTISPGTSPGILNTGDVTFTAGASFDVEVVNTTNPAAGTDYDQLNVTGTVDLGGANLNLIDSSVGGATPNVILTIVNNDVMDAVVGTFNGLADGDTVMLGGEEFKIFYGGGDGNDVVLIENSAPNTVYVDDDFTQNDGEVIPDADLSTLGAQPAIFGISAFNTIAEAVAAVAENGTVVVNLGTYAGNVAIPKSLTLDGSGPGTIIDAAGDGVSLDGGANITIRDFEINAAGQGIVDNAALIANLNLLNLQIDGNGPNPGGSLDGVTALNVTFTANNDMVDVDNMQFRSTGVDSIAYANVGALTLNGNDGADVFDVDPISDTMLTINGGSPTGPASPADSLIYNGPGLLNFATIDSGTISQGGFQDVAFNEMEAVSTDQVTGNNGNFLIDAGDDANDNDADSFIVRQSASGNIEVVVIDDLGNEIIVLSQPAATVNSLTIQGSDDNDTLTVDYVNGVPVPTGGLFYQGFGDGINDNDVLNIRNGSVESVTHAFTNSSNGSVNIESEAGVFQNITYTGLEPITDTLIAGTRMFNFGAASDEITLADDGPNLPGISRISSASTSETVDFANPTTELIVNSAGGNDTLTVLALDADFDADVTLNGGSGRDVFDLEATTGSTANVFTLNGDQGADTFNISPTQDAGPNIAINGNTPASSPGDALYYDGAATITPTALGSGTLTPAEMTDQAIDFSGIESLNPANPARLSIADATITEGTGGTTVMTFTVSLSNGFVQPVTVGVSTANGSAFAGSDFTSMNETLTFTLPDDDADGDDDVLTQTVSVVINPDTVVEFDEDFIVRLDNADGATILDGTAIGTITDDDQALISIGDVTQTEAAGLFNFTVNLSNPVAAATTVTVNTAPTGIDPATANEDFLSLMNQVVTFAPGGALSQTVTVQVLNDEVVEADETFNVLLSNPQFGGVADTNRVDIDMNHDTGLGTIVNNDTATLTIGEVSQAEGDAGTSLMTFTVTLSAAVQGGFDVTYVTTDDTAIAGDDYEAASVDLTFAGNAGETQTVSVTINGDTDVEPNETFLVGVSPASELPTTLLVGPDAVGTILNDDIDIDIAPINAARNEGNFGDTAFTYSITRTGDLSGSTTVNYAVSSAGGNLDANDFGGNFPAGQIAFAPGQSVQTLTILVQGDQLVELDEMFTVTLTGASGNAEITTPTADGTILNDDSANITITNVTQAEGNLGSTIFDFTVTLDKAVDAPVTFDADTVDGTATTGDMDYTALSIDDIQFPAGSMPGATQTLSVEVLGDLKVELDEAFLLRLSDLMAGGRAVAFAGGMGTLDGQGRIINDDSATLSIDSVTDLESNTPFLFTVTLSRPVGEDVTVDVTMALVSASAADFDMPANTQLTFTPDGPLTQQVSVPVTDDDLVEFAETFTLNLELETFAGQPADSRITIDPDRGSGTGTILNDDQVVFSITDATIVNEVDEPNGPLTFEINLQDASGTATGPFVDGDNRLTVDVVAIPGSAQGGGNDFSFTPVTLEFAAGGTSTQTVDVSIFNDDLVESDEEFVIQLLNPRFGNSTVGLLPDSNRVTLSATEGMRTGRILDEDMATIVIDDVRATEGTLGGFEFTVTLDGMLSEDVTLLANTDVGSGTAPAMAAATSDVDFTSVSNQLITFNAGGPLLQTETVTVQVDNDGISEPVEDFLVRLSNVEFGGMPGFGRVILVANAPSANNPAPVAGEGRGIIDDSTGPIEAAFADGSLSVGNPEGTSTPGSATFTIELTDPIQENVSVFVNTATTNFMNGRDAVEDVDFTPLTDFEVMFAPGETSKTVTVNFLADAVVEPNEVFQLVIDRVEIAGLSDPRAGVGANDTATGSILNDDFARLIIRDSMISEGDSGNVSMQFAVVLDKLVQGGVSVDFATSSAPASTINIPAQANVDFESQTGTLQFTGTVTNDTQTIQVNVTGDTLTERDEIFLLSLLRNSLATEAGNPIQNGSAINLQANDTTVMPIQNATVTGTIVNNDSILVTAPDAGGGPHVKVFNQLNDPPAEFMAYSMGFTGGVRVATGDVTGDGIPDIITAPGPGGGPNIRVFDGSRVLAEVGQIVVPTIFDFMAYDDDFTGGVFVSAADVNGDGIAEIITSPDAGGGPHIRVFNLTTGTPINPNDPFTEFLAYDPNFEGGVRIATGDVDGDGEVDLITGPGAGGGPHIRAFDLTNVRGGASPELRSFFAFNEGDFVDGVYVAAADFTGDGMAEIVVGQGARSRFNFDPTTENGRVRVFNSVDQSFTQINVFRGFTGGVRVGTAERVGNNTPDLTTASGPGINGLVRTFDGQSIADILDPANNSEFLFPSQDATTRPIDELDIDVDPDINAQQDPIADQEQTPYSDFMGGIFVAGTLLDPTAGSPLRLAGSTGSGQSPHHASREDVNATVIAAVQRWEQAGLDSSIASQLGATPVLVQDLAPGLLGLEANGVVFIDDDAAGAGWFIDPTPLTDEEIGDDANLLGRVDLLTVVLHELGHVLGLDDLDADAHPGRLMAESLSPNVRRLPDEETLDALFADTDFSESLLTEQA